MIQTVPSLDGHDIAVRIHNPDAGNAPLVCIHGITSSVEAFSIGQIDWILKDQKCICLGLPGHFPAKFPQGFRSEQLIADTIADLIWKALDEVIGDTQQVVIGGHSTGGFAALAMALSRPERVRGIFCISGFVQGRWTGVLGLLQQFVRMGPIGRFLFRCSLSFLQMHRRIFKLALFFYAHDIRALYAAPTLDRTIDSVFPHFQQLDLCAMQAWFHQMPLVDLGPFLSRIRAPTLVVHGRQDPIVPWVQGIQIAKGVPKGQLVVLEGAGHLPSAERPEEFEAAMREFLASL